jgi:nitrous oxidase accessory protein
MKTLSITTIGVSIYPYYSNNNVFYHNNFVGNIYNVYAEQTANIWCYNGEGNYWDDYEGEDLDKDGIGNTPYVITGKTPIIIL